MSKKLLVDADCGTDDAQAIMLALAAPNVELLGITCVHGNTTVENVCKNALRVLQACNKLEIPVFKGAAKPILGNTLNAGHFHGLDGLGDAPDPDAPGLDLVQKESAVTAMIRIVNENPGEVSLVATAPLTNLALAVRIDPSLPSKLRGLYIMGGNTESRGNTTVCAEFNFAADPEAAYIVLNEYQCPTYLACWEFTCYSKLSWEFCDAWLAQDTHKARFMARIFQHSIKASKSECFEEVLVGGGGFVSCDSYAVAAAVDDSFILESDRYPVSVELTGTHTRGMMIVDTLGLLKKTCQAFIMKKEFCDAWLAQDTHKARFMARIFQHSIKASQSERFEKEFVGGGGFVSCDSYAVAAAVDDSFVLESDRYPVSVELTGTHTRGMMVVDTLGLLKKTCKAFIMKKVDMKMFEQMMMAALK